MKEREKMSEIKITENKVEMTITYSESFSNESEMLEAVKGAAELRGLIAKPEGEEMEGEV